MLGAILATLLLWALIGKQGSAGMTLLGSGPVAGAVIAVASPMSCGPGWWAQRGAGSTGDARHGLAPPGPQQTLSPAGPAQAAWQRRGVGGGSQE
jgi:hypothetical protein